MQYLVLGAVIIYFSYLEYKLEYFKFYTQADHIMRAARSQGSLGVGVHWDRVRMLCSSSTTSDVIEARETAAQQKLTSHIPRSRGTAALSCHLQVSRDVA